MSLKKAVMLRFLGILAAIVLFVGSMATAIWLMQETRTAVADINDESLKLSAAISAHYSWEEGLLAHIALDHSFTGALDPTACAFGQFFYSDTVQKNARYASILSSVEAAHNAIHTGGSQVIASNSSSEKYAIYESSIEPNVNSLVDMLNNQLDTNTESINTANSALDVVISGSIIAIVVASVILLIVCLNLLTYLVTQVIDPISYIKNESVKLSQGQLALNFSCKAKSADMNDLSEALNTSVGELQRMINNISDSMSELANKNFSIYPTMTFPGEFRTIESSMAKLIDQIRSTMHEISSSATLVKSESETFSGAAQSLAHGSVQQASGVDELTSTVDSIMEKVTENAENAKSASHYGSAVTEVIDESINYMADLLGAMTEIQESSTNIEKIIKTIDDIAFQTNILALNAAVEAARAGQAGKGFAVVADEVRNLAQKSTEAANNTTLLIRSSLESVEKGVHIANGTNESFNKVSDSSREVINLISSIATASEEQSESVHQISVGLNQISDVVQKNSATSQESAASSEELSAQSNTLEQLVSAFRLQ